jgi:hypothetical protein
LHLLLGITTAITVDTKTGVGVGEKYLVPLTENSQNGCLALVEAVLEIFDVLL